MAPGRVRRGALTAVAVVVVLGATGCIGATDRSDFDAEIQRRGGGVTSELVTEPLARLRDAVGVDDPELLALSISPADRTVVFEVRDPRLRRNVDRYTSRGGGLGAPDPVRISATDDLDTRSFRASELPALDELETVADAAIAALQFEDGYVNSIDVGLSDGAPVLTVHVSSPRSQGVAVFDRSGTLLGATPQ